MHAARTLPYRADIDGLRAVAVLGVILYHAGHLLPGGFAGVDVFFVISGYLIFQRLVQGPVRLGAFYRRRLLRIAPAALVATLAVLLLARWRMVPADLARTGDSALSHLLLASNHYFHATAGYFDVAAIRKPLLHMWSLAVEEQVYLLLPLLVLLFQRFLGSRWLSAALVVLAAGSFACAGWLLQKDPSAAFYWMPSRLWEFLLGAMAAQVPYQRVPFLARRRACADVLATVGLALVVAPMFLYGPTTPFPGLMALPPVLGATLLVWCGGAGRFPGMLLGSRPCVWVGKLSYSLYLWHWPLLVFGSYHAAKLDPPVPWLWLATLPPIAWASWKFVETPFQYGIPRATSRLRLKLAAMCGFVAVLAFSFSIQGRLPGPLEKPGRNDVFYDTAIDKAVKAEGGRTWSVLNEPEGVEKTPEHTVILWGDSHAYVLSRTVAEIAHHAKMHAFIMWRGAHAPILLREDDPLQDAESFRDQQRRILQLLDTNPAKRMLIVARWSLYLRMLDGRMGDPVKAEAVMSDGLQRTLDQLTERGTEVWIMCQVPEQPENVRLVAELAAKRGELPSFRGTEIGEHLRMHSRVNRVLNGLASKHVHVIDGSRLLPVVNGRFMPEADGQLLYGDEHHLSAAGAARLAPLLTPIFGDNPRDGDSECGHGVRASQP